MFGASLISIDADKLEPVAVVAVAGLAGWLLWRRYRDRDPNAGTPLSQQNIGAADSIAVMRQLGLLRTVQQTYPTTPYTYSPSGSAHAAASGGAMAGASLPGGATA